MGYINRLKGLTLLLVLLTSIVNCSRHRVVFDRPEKEKYPSRQEREYYDGIVYQEFKPEDTTFINNWKYDYVSIREAEMDNKFIDIWEQTKFDRYYDSLYDICAANRNRIEDYRDTIADRKFSVCMDSIRKVHYSKKIGDVSCYAILRYDSLGDLKIMLYKDPRLEERNLGYWIAISEDGGKSWRHYYTGLVENHFYHVKPNPRIRFIKNDRIVQAEFALVRKTKPETPPVGAPEFELLKDNLVMELDLTKLTADLDRDGLTDILEKKFFTDSEKADTDDDGIDDATDTNPRYKNVKSKYSNLFKYLLERPTMGNVFVSFDEELEVRAHKDDRIETYLVVTDDPDLLNLAGTRNKYIILTKAEFEQYRKDNYIPLRKLGVSPLFDVDRKPGVRKIHINGDFWGHDYLLIEKADGWSIKDIGGYII